MAGIEWIKVATDMFDRSRKIKQIELMPKGDTYLVIWWKLLLLAGTINDGGRIYVTPSIPYTVPTLANELRRPATTVKKALEIFEQFGMVQRDGDVFVLPSWGKYQNIDGMERIREQNRKRQAKYKSAQKESAGDNGEGNVTGNVTITQGNATEERIRKRIKKDISNSMSVCSTKEPDEGENTDGHTDIPESSKISSCFSSCSNFASARKLMGGELGGGVVFLSEEQMHDLLDRLSADEFDRYVGIVRDQEQKGNHYTSKSHYQAILEMAEKDRRVQ